MGLLGPCYPAFKNIMKLVSLLCRGFLFSRARCVESRLGFSVPYRRECFSGMPNRCYHKYAISYDFGIRKGLSELDLGEFYLNKRPRFLQMLVFGACFQTTSYIFQFFLPRWPWYVCSFFVAGIGMAIQVNCLFSLWSQTRSEIFISVQDAHANAFVALIRRQNELKMGILHASYGEDHKSRLSSYHKSRLPTVWAHSSPRFLRLSLLNYLPGRPIT